MKRLIKFDGRRSLGQLHDFLQDERTQNVLLENPGEYITVKGKHEIEIVGSNVLDFVKRFFGKRVKEIPV